MDWATRQWAEARVVRPGGFSGVVTAPLTSDREDDFEDCIIDVHGMIPIGASTSFGAAKARARSSKVGSGDNGSRC